MGTKLLWTGLTIIVTAPVTHVPAAAIVGSVIMVIGCVLVWLDK
jgi:hypothetical protein